MRGWLLSWHNESGGGRDGDEEDSAIAPDAGAGPIRVVGVISQHRDDFASAAAVLNRVLDTDAFEVICPSPCVRTRAPTTSNSQSLTFTASSILAGFEPGGS